MVNNHFVDESLFSSRVDQVVVVGARDCFSMFFQASGAMANDHKTDY